MAGNNPTKRLFPWKPSKHRYSGPKPKKVSLPWHLLSIARKRYPASANVALIKHLEQRMPYSHLISWSSSTQCYSTQCFPAHNVLTHNAIYSTQCYQLLHPFLLSRNISSMFNFLFFWTYSTQCLPFQWHILCLILKVEKFS